MAGNREVDFGIRQGAAAPPVQLVQEERFFIANTSARHPGAEHLLARHGHRRARVQWDPAPARHPP